jgi:uncharacterized iron-regulated membrane protein
MMNAFLRKLHRWLGFPLGLLFLVTFATGFLNAIDELASRKQYAGLDYRKTGPDEDARALALITRNHQGIRQIVMPTENTPYYQAVLRGERYTYAIDNLGRPIHEQDEEGGFFETVLQLHRNYLLGKQGLWGIDGKYYAASVALLALLISLIGFWLWWPLRATFRLKKVLPARAARTQLYQAHMAGGVVMLAAIALMSLTGASITYRPAAQWIFGVDPEQQTMKEPVSLDHGWHAWLSAAHAAMPGGELTGIRFPRSSQNDAAQILEFRFLAPGDWLGLPGSKVLIDRNESALVGVSAFKDLPPGEKFYSILKPLHMGKGLHAGYVLLQLALSLLGIIMVLSGISSFVIKKRGWQWLKRGRPMRAAVKA